MLIECLIQREGPTDQHIGGVRYVFMPRPELTGGVKRNGKIEGGDTKANVCEIQKEEIVEYLLNTAHFRQYLPAAEPEPVKGKREIDEDFTGE
jgi:hypothetical protein